MSAPGKLFRPAPGRSQRLAALFLLATLLFNYPLLWLSSTDGTVFGVPSLYVYLFSAWAVVIAAMAATIERAGR